MENKPDFTSLTVDISPDKLLIDGKPLPEVIQQHGLVETMSDLRNIFMEECIMLTSLLTNSDDLDKAEFNRRLNERISRIALPAIMIARINKAIHEVEENEQKQVALFNA